VARVRRNDDGGRQTGNIASAPLNQLKQVKPKQRQRRNCFNNKATWNKSIKTACTHLSALVGTYFSDKRHSLGQFSLLADKGHGVIIHYY
jgi:hypothetical protein